MKYQDINPESAPAPLARKIAREFFRKSRRDNRRSRIAAKHSFLNS